METTVKEWMTGDPVWIEPAASAREALDRMVDRGIRHLPVVDDKRRVIGVCSADDLRAVLPWHPGTPPSAETAADALQWTVGDVMTHAPVTARKTTGLGEAAESMARWRIGCLPVVDDEGGLLGILSETDLLHALSTMLWAGTRDVRQARKPDRERLLDELRRERDALRERVRSDREPAGSNPSTEVVAGPAMRESEHASAQYLQRLSLARLAKISHAMERAQDPSFGVCEQCGHPIPLLRLRALPMAKLCIACARV
jgi:acetoin utilization protein AcuB